MLRKLASFNNMDVRSPVPRVNNFQEIFRRGEGGHESPFRGTPKRVLVPPSPQASKENTVVPHLLFNGDAQQQQGSPLGKRRSNDQLVCGDAVPEHGDERGTSTGQQQDGGSTPNKRSRVKGTLRGSIRGSIRGLKRKQKAVASLFSPRAGTAHVHHTEAHVGDGVRSTAGEPPAAQPPKQPGLTFGQPLEKVMENQRAVFPELNIPSLVHDAIHYVRSNALQVEGIFRLSGPHEKIQRIQQAYDLVLESNPFPNQRDPHVVTCVLKQFLRELPEPLLTDALASDFLSVISPDKAEDDPFQLSHLKHLISKLPSINRAVLTEIMALAVDVVAYENTNKMTADNMARVLGPNLVNLDSYSAHLSMIAIQAVNEVARIMITQFEQLFPGVRTATSSASAAAATTASPTTTSATDVEPLSAHSDSTATACASTTKKHRSRSKHRRTTTRKSSTAMIEAASAFSSSAAITTLPAVAAPTSQEDLLKAVAVLQAAAASPRAEMIQQHAKTLPMTPPQLQELQDQVAQELNSPGVLTRSQARRIQLIQELEEGSTSLQ